MKLKQQIWYFLCKHLLRYLPPYLFANIVFLINCIRLRRPYYLLSINRPRTFTEKINWLKFNTFNPDYIGLADKYDVRAFVSNRIGEQYLVPLLAVFNTSNEIDFTHLPDKFVLKATHGSGLNLFVKDKKMQSIDRVRKLCSDWLTINPYFLSREWQYKDINPKIICEHYLDENPNDYKFFCFGGRVRFIQVDVDRFTAHTRTIFTRDWEELNIEYNYKKSERVLSPPAELDTMIKLSEELARDFNFVRVDLFNISNTIYFGELTFFPGGGAEPFNSYDADLNFGRGLELNRGSGK